MWNIWQSELRMTVRQRSYYSLLVLWVAVWSLLFLLQSSAPSLVGYTNITGTVVNVTLYIIPLFMLITGSFSVANEQENGQWRLLSTYPVATASYIIGKIGGQFTAQMIVFTFSYGLSLVISLVSGNSFSSEWVLAIYFFAIALIYFFIILGVTIGCTVSTRWQALSVSVIIWFFLVMIWPTALIGVLGFVPYSWIAPIMEVALFINPAEFTRITLLISLDAGAVFGQAYDSLVTFLQSPFKVVVHIAYFIVFLLITLAFSVFLLERRKRR